MQEQKTETINIGGPIDVERLRRELATMSTLSADEAKQAVSEMTRRLHRQGAAMGKTTSGAREVLSHLLDRGFRPLDPPTGMNRAQRRALAKKNR